MFRRKYIRLCRKFLGSIVRPKSGIRSQLTRGCKVLYLIVSGGFEIVGDTLFFLKRRDSLRIPNPGRILVIKVDQLGDVIFSSLLIPGIKRKFPQAQIDFLVRPGAEAILRGNPGVNAVYQWNNIVLDLLPGRGRRTPVLRKIRANWSTRQKLRRNGYDVAINARAYPPSSNFFWKGVAGALIAFDISEQSFLADYWGPYDLDAEEWSNYANLLAPLGIDSSSVGVCGEFYNYDVPNPMDASPYAVISPVTFDRDRQWKTEHWISLIAALSSRGIAVAITGMPSQREFLEKLAFSVSRGEMVRVFTDLRLSQFGALMDRAAIFVGIDSFPAHLALALKKPVRLLVNSDVYFLKGYSRSRFASEARSMIPASPLAAFFDARSALPDEIIASCAETLNQSAPAVTGPFVVPT
jgi:ADP-heptose:LPS heptosyltransferase